MPRKYEERKVLDMGYWCPVPGCLQWMDHKTKVSTHLNTGLGHPPGYHCVGCNEYCCGSRSLHAHLKGCGAWVNMQAQTGQTNK